LDNKAIDKLKGVQLWGSKSLHIIAHKLCIIRTYVALLPSCLLPMCIQFLIMKADTRRERKYEAKRAFSSSILEVKQQ